MSDPSHNQAETGEGRGQVVKAWVFAKLKEYGPAGAFVGALATITVQLFTLGVQNDIQEKQTEIQHDLSVSDRYNDAVMHLASDDPIERISGIYGLKDLTVSEPGTSTRALRVLASYLVTKNGANDTNSNEKAVASGTLNAISRQVDHDPDTFPLAYDLSNVDLSGYYLGGLRAHGGFFVGIDVSSANLAGAEFTCTNFAGADLSTANLTGAKFDNVFVDEWTSFYDAKGADADAFANLYWEEDNPGPVLPDGARGQRKGTLRDYESVCAPPETSSAAIAGPTESPRMD